MASRMCSSDKFTIQGGLLSICNHCPFDGHKTKHNTNYKWNARRGHSMRIYVNFFNVYEDEMGMVNHIYIHPHTQHTYCDYIINVLCCGSGQETQVIQLVYFAYITGTFYRKFKQSQKRLHIKPPSLQFQMFILFARMT